MKKELDEQLCKEFPMLYAQRNLPMTETALCWGFPGDGWFILIHELSGFITRVIDNEKKYNRVSSYKKEHGIPYSQDLTQEQLAELKLDEIRVEAVQVKEKYGTLRFYWDGYGMSADTHEYISGAVSFAESMSSRICEICGKTGFLRKGGWIQTLCEDHAEGREHLDWNSDF